MSSQDNPPVPEGEVAAEDFVPVETGPGRTTVGNYDLARAIEALYRDPNPTGGVANRLLEALAAQTPSGVSGEFLEAAEEVVKSGNVDVTDPRFVSVPEPIFNRLAAQLLQGTGKDEKTKDAAALCPDEQLGSGDGDRSGESDGPDQCELAGNNGDGTCGRPDCEYGSPCHMPSNEAEAARAVELGSTDYRLTLLRSLPERADNLLPSELDWLDATGFACPDGSHPEGHEDIDVWATTEGGQFVLDLAAANTPPSPPEGPKPTGTIFDLDMFRERLEKWSGEIWNGTEELDRSELSNEIENRADELKALIDNCQAQYVPPEGHLPVYLPVEDVAGIAHTGFKEDCPDSEDLERFETLYKACRSALRSEGGEV